MKTKSNDQVDEMEKNLKEKEKEFNELAEKIKEKDYTIQQLANVQFYFLKVNFI